jgi:hypothetical protein
MREKDTSSRGSAGPFRAPDSGLLGDSEAQIAVSTAAPPRRLRGSRCRVFRMLRPLPARLRYYESSAHVTFSNGSSLPPASRYLLSASHSLSFCRCRWRLSCWILSQGEDLLPYLVNDVLDSVKLGRSSALCRSEAPSPKTARSMQK